MPPLLTALKATPQVPRACYELALARLSLERITPLDILTRNKAAEALEVAGNQHGVRGDMEVFVQRVAFIIPRLATRVPWRADCLVQALAGQHWLAAQQVPTQIAIGVARGASEEFLAHAWLKRGEEVLLGGAITQFNLILDPGNRAEKQKGKQEHEQGD